MDNQTKVIAGIFASTIIWQGFRIRRLHKCIDRVVDVLYEHLEDAEQAHADILFQDIVDNFDE